MVEFKALPQEVLLCKENIRSLDEQIISYNWEYNRNADSMEDKILLIYAYEVHQRDIAK